MDRLKSRATRADDIVEQRRAGVAREWQDLKGAVRSETGLSMVDVAWAAGIGGLAMGLELARRWVQWTGRRLKP